MRRAYAPYSQANGYPVKTHKRDVYWRVAALLGWTKAVWWNRLSAHPSMELQLLEDLVRDAETGTPEALILLKEKFGCQTIDPMP